MCSRVCVSELTCSAAVQHKLTTFVRSLCLLCHIKTPHYLLLCHWNSNCSLFLLLTNSIWSLSQSVCLSLSLTVLSLSSAAETVLGINFSIFVWNHYLNERQLIQWRRGQESSELASINSLHNLSGETDLCNVIVINPSAASQAVTDPMGAVQHPEGEGPAHWSKNEDTEILAKFRLSQSQLRENSGSDLLSICAKKIKKSLSLSSWHHKI